MGRLMRRVPVRELAAPFRHHRVRSKKHSVRSANLLITHIFGLIGDGLLEYPADGSQ